MQTKQIGLILLCAILVISMFATSIPFTEPQFYAQASDINYDKLANGDYNGLFLFMDGNKISLTDLNDLNISGGSTDWTNLTNFPTGCPSGQAVQVIGSTLTCVAVGGGDGNDNVDGGFANSVYLPSQIIDGGGA